MFVPGELGEKAGVSVCEREGEGQRERRWSSS